MSKESYYFSHDYDPVSDIKMVAMTKEFGALGYGLYWRIVEMLHSENEHKLPLKKLVFLAISSQLNVAIETIEKFINESITTYELFKSDGESFWSERVLKNVSKRESIKHKRSLAGQKSAFIKQMSTSVQQTSTHVEQVATSVQQNSTKEKKRKERKGKKEEKKFSPPSLQEVKDYFKENGYKVSVAERAYKGYAENNWHDSKNNPVLNWKSKMNNVWFKDENIDPGIAPKERKLVEKPMTMEDYKAMFS